MSLEEDKATIDDAYEDKDVDFIAYKYNGDWYLADALDLIILAAMSC